MSVGRSGSCRPSGGGRSHTEPPKTLHLLSFYHGRFRWEWERPGTSPGVGSFTLHDDCGLMLWFTGHFGSL